MTSRSQRSTASLAVLALIVALLTAATFTNSAERAQAANAADFDPGMLISDAVFYNGSAMNAAQVQSFLNDKGSGCGSNCLKHYRERTYSIPATSRCRAYTSSGTETAAQIIAKVGEACGISQRALLVLLQKETSLVTMDDPGDWRYDRAMGYYCPDDPSRPGWCHPEYGGFFNQTYNAAAQFQRYRQNQGDYSYQAGRSNRIAYHPDSFAGRCGFQDVYIRNQATAGLYIYTPYVPNRAALNNLYGTGDSCSAYGNRNFWRMYTDWFGSTSVDDRAGSPVGHLDSVSVVPGGVRVGGWTADPSGPSTGLTVVVAHAGGTTDIIANLDRPDVGRVFPQYGSRHGFNHVIEVPPGSQRICVTAANTGPGRDSELGCANVDVPAADPFGVVDSIVHGVEGIRVRGWAIDPDASRPVTLTATWATGSTTFQVGAHRPDVARHYPDHGAYQGFDQTITMRAGTRQVCLRIEGQGFGGSTDLGCRAVRVYSHNPMGSIDNVTATPGAVSVSGWAADPSAGSDSTYVRVTVSGTTTGALAAGARPDVARVYPELGPNHGFRVRVPASSGSQRVCVTAVNRGAGSDRLIGCRDVTVPPADIIGAFDSATGIGGGVRVNGWAWDPDGSAPAQVRVTVDGAQRDTIATSVRRPDVVRAYPSAPGQSGFSGAVSAAPGWHDVCVIAVNQNSGGDAPLGCRRVRAFGHDPVGYVDSVVVRGGQVVVSGWAADADALGERVSLRIKVGSTSHSTTTGLVRADVQRFAPEYGGATGYRAVIPLPAGSTSVCVTALNVGEGRDAPLGCTRVSR